MISILAFSSFCVCIIALQAKKDLLAVNSTEYDEGDGVVDSEDERTREETQEHSASDMDSDEERRR